jgi:hypothetical protein
MASTQFQPTGLDYLILDFDSKTGKTGPVAEGVKEVNLTFTRNAEGSWTLNSTGKVIGLVASGTLTGMLFPVPDVNKAKAPITKLPKKSKK